MFKPIRFLHAAVLTLTSAVAIQIDTLKEATGWNDMPIELQQHVFDQLNAKEVSTAAQVSRQWHKLAQDNRGWKNRVQCDFPGDQERPADGENWQSVYKKLKGNWVIKGDFAEVFGSRYPLQRQFSIEPRDRSKSNIDIIELEGYKGGTILISIRLIAENAKVLAELTKADLLKVESPSASTLPKPIFRFNDKSRFVEFLDVFINNRLIPPLLSRIILSKAKVEPIIQDKPLPESSVLGTRSYSSISSWVSTLEDIWIE